MDFVHIEVQVYFQHLFENELVPSLPYALLQGTQSKLLILLDSNFGRFDMGCLHVGDLDDVLFLLQQDLDGLAGCVAEADAKCVQLIHMEIIMKAYIKNSSVSQYW